MTLLLPSQQEQKKIVSEVEAKISTTNFIEKSLDESLSRTSHLRQSILNKAFSGKLVPQDPNDEPAAVLLERIRMQKEKQKDGGKGKKTA